MADKSEGSLDGKPLSSLRVVDLKNALQERGLPKGGSKKELVERLKLQLEIEKLQQESADAKDQVPNLALQDELGGQNDFVRQYLAAQQQTFAMQLKERRLTELQASGSTPERPSAAKEAPTAPRHEGPQLPVAVGERAKRESWERKRGRQCPSSIDPGGLLESPTRGEPPLEADAPTEARRTRLSTRQGDLKSEVKIERDTELKSELHIRVKIEPKRKPKARGHARSEPRQLRHTLSPTDHPPKKKQLVEPSPMSLPSESEEDACKRLQGPKEEHSAVGMLQRVVRSPRKAAMAPVVLLRPLELQTPRYPSRRRQSSSDESAKNLPQEESLTSMGDDTNKLTASDLQESGAVQPSLDAQEGPVPEARPRLKRRDSEARKGNAPPEKSRNDSTTHTRAHRRPPRALPKTGTIVLDLPESRDDTPAPQEARDTGSVIQISKHVLRHTRAESGQVLEHSEMPATSVMLECNVVNTTDSSVPKEVVSATTSSDLGAPASTQVPFIQQSTPTCSFPASADMQLVSEELGQKSSQDKIPVAAHVQDSQEAVNAALVSWESSQEFSDSPNVAPCSKDNKNIFNMATERESCIVFNKDKPPIEFSGTLKEQKDSQNQGSKPDTILMPFPTPGPRPDELEDASKVGTSDTEEHSVLLDYSSIRSATGIRSKPPVRGPLTVAEMTSAVKSILETAVNIPAAAVHCHVALDTAPNLVDEHEVDNATDSLLKEMSIEPEDAAIEICVAGLERVPEAADSQLLGCDNLQEHLVGGDETHKGLEQVMVETSRAVLMDVIPLSEDCGMTPADEGQECLVTSTKEPCYTAALEKQKEDSSAAAVVLSERQVGAASERPGFKPVAAEVNSSQVSNGEKPSTPATQVLLEEPAQPPLQREEATHTTAPPIQSETIAALRPVTSTFPEATDSSAMRSFFCQDNNATNQEVKIQAFITQVSDLHSHEVSLSLTTANEKSEKSSDTALADADSCPSSTAECSTQLSETASTCNSAGMLQYPNEKLEVALFDKNYDEHTRDASPNTCLHQLEQRPYVAELAYSTVKADEVQVEALTSLPEVTVDSGTVCKSSDPPSGASAPCLKLNEDPVGGKALETTLSIEGTLEEHLETHVASISQSQASRQDASITKQQDTEPAQKQATASEKGCFEQYTYYIDACKPQLETELSAATVSEVTTSLQTTTAGTSLTKQQDTEVARVKESVEDMQYEIQHHASIDPTNDICKSPQVDLRRDQTFETTKALIPMPQATTEPGITSPQETDVAREEPTTTEGMPSCLENNAPVDASMNVCMSPQITLEAEYMHSALIRASTPELQASTVELGILARQERDNRPQDYPPVDATVDLKISQVLPEEDSTTQISVAPFQTLERTTLEACVNTQQRTREETTSIAEVQPQALTILDPRNDTCVTSQAELEETSTHPTAIEIAGSEPDVLMTETDITRQQGADIVIKEDVEEAHNQFQDYASIDVSPQGNSEKECTVVNKASMHQANKDLHIIRGLEIAKEAAATEEAQSQDHALVHDRTDVFKTCQVESEEPIDPTIRESPMPQPASTVETCNIVQESGRTAREEATSTESMQYQYQGHVSVDAASDAYQLGSVKSEDSSTPSVARRGTGYASKCYTGIATEAASTTDLPSDQLKNHVSVDDTTDVCKASQAEAEKESAITVLQTDQDTEMVKENGTVTKGMQCHSCVSESDCEHRSSAISAIPITNIEIATANRRDMGVAKREPMATVEMQRTSTDVALDACKLSEVEPRYPPMDTATSEAPIMIVQENIVETGAACQQDAEIAEKGLAATEEMQLHTEHHSSTDASLDACEASKVKSEDQPADTVVGESLISTHQSITIQSDVSSSQSDTEAVKKEVSVTDGMQCQIQNHSRDVCQLSCVQSGFQPTDTTESKAPIATFQATIMESGITSQQGPKFATVIEGSHYRSSNQAPVDASRSQVQPEEEPTDTDQASAALVATLQATTADTSATSQQDTEVDKEESTVVREAHNHPSSYTATADECSAFQAECNRESADVAITGTVEARAEAVSQVQHCIASMPEAFTVTSAACARDIAETTSQLNTEISNAPELLYSMGSTALLHKEQAQTEHPYDCTVSTRCPNSADVASNIVTTSSAIELAMRNVPLETHPKEPQALSHININVPGAVAVKATGVTTEKPSQISNLGSADSSQLDVVSSVSDPTPSNIERCDSTYEASKTPDYSHRILHERISSTPDSTGTERPVLVSVTCKNQTPSVKEISEQKKVVESTPLLETLNLPSSSESREDCNAGLKCPETSQLACSMHCLPITELRAKTTEENRDVQAKQGHDVQCQPCPGTSEGDERLPENLKPCMLRENLDEMLPSCNVGLSERCQETKGACMTEDRASFDNTSRCSNCPQSQEIEKVPFTRALSSLEVGIENPIGTRPQASSSPTNPNSLTETLMQCSTPCHVNLDSKEETSSVPQCHRAAPRVQGDINRLGTDQDVLGLAKRSSSSSSTSGSSTSGSGSSGSTNGSSESDSSGSSGDDSSSSSSDSSASDEERGAAMARLRGRGVRKQAVRTAKEATSDQEASDREGSDGEESDSGGQAHRQLRNGRRARSPPEEGRVTRRTLRQRKAGGDAPDEAPKREDSSDTERDGSPAEERRSPEKAAEEDPNGKVAPADEEQQPSGPAWKETLAIKVLNLSSDSSESSEAEEERVGRRALKGTGPTSPPRSPSAAAPEAAPQEERESPRPPAEESSKKDGGDAGGVEVAEEDEAGRPESEEPAKEENSTPPDIEMKQEAPRSISPPKFKARRISTAALKRESRDKEDKPQRKRRWGSTNVVVGPSVSISTSALKDLIPDLEPVASKMKEESLASVPEEPVASADKPAPDKGEDAELAKTSDEPPAKVQAVAAPVVQPKEAKPVVEDGQPVSERKPIHALADRAPLSRRAKEESVRKEPSPAKNPKTRTLFVRNLVRPFTLNQLKQLLLEFGETVDSEFWIDKIKSKCFVTYTTEEEAAKARDALHNLRWPLCNPKILHVDFSTPEEMARQKEPPAPRPPAPLPAPAMPVAPDRSAAPAFHRTVEVEPRPPGRDVREARDPREVRGARDSRDVRDARDVRESRNVRESREPRDAREGRGDPRALPVRLPVREEHRTAPERQAAPAPRRAPMREWDRDKLRQETPPQEQRPRPPKDVKDRAHTPDKKERRDKKVAKRKQEDTPAKLLDDLFRKTKATPCIYWLPLTDDQIAHKEEERKQRRLDRERRRQQQQLQEEEDRRKRALARDLDSKARDSKRTGSHSPVRRR